MTREQQRIGARFSRIAIDFDGVITEFDFEKFRASEATGFDWIGKEIDGMKETVKLLIDSGQEVVIFTVRPSAQVHQWLAARDWPDLEVTDVKTGFHVILDDRAIQFSPALAREPKALAARLMAFAPWWMSSSGVRGPLRHPEARLPQEGSEPPVKQH